MFFQKGIQTAWKLSRGFIKFIKTTNNKVGHERADMMLLKLEHTFSNRKNWMVGCLNLAHPFPLRNVAVVCSCAIHMASAAIIFWNRYVTSGKWSHGHNKVRLRWQVKILNPTSIWIYGWRPKSHLAVSRNHYITCVRLCWFPFFPRMTIIRGVERKDRHFPSLFRFQPGIFISIIFILVEPEQNGRFFNTFSSIKMTSCVRLISFLLHHFRHFLVGKTGVKLFLYKEEYVLLAVPESEREKDGMSFK